MGKKTKAVKVTDKGKPWEKQKNAYQYQPLKLANKTILIVCEGQTEEWYFRKFPVVSLSVKCVNLQGQSKLNLVRATEEIIKDDDYTFDEVWCVYDRDRSFDSNEADKNDISFNASLLIAESHNIKVAWSNDCFELWVLLHFEDVECTEVLLRDIYYDRLTKIIEANEELCKNFSKAIETGHYNYKECFKQERNFKEHILPELQQAERRTKAIERADKLEQQHLTKRKAHEKCPCTMVHYLVKELLSCQ